LKKGNIELALPWYHWFSCLASTPIHNILMFRPLIIVASLLTSSSPFFTLFPFCYIDHTPYHNCESIQKISRAVIGSIIEEYIKDYSQQSDYSREDKPLLKKADKIEIRLRIGSNILAKTSEYNAAIFWILMYRHKFLEACVSHNICQRINLLLLVSWSSLLFHWKINKEVILGPQFFLRGEKFLVLYYVPVPFRMIKNRVHFLFINVLISRKHPSPNPFEVITHSNVLLLFGQVYLLVEGF